MGLGSDDVGTSRSEQAGKAGWQEIPGQSNGIFSFCRPGERETSDLPKPEGIQQAQPPPGLQVFICKGHSGGNLSEDRPTFSKQSSR